MCAIAAGSVAGAGKPQSDAQEHAKALARIMILDGRYFPQELYSDRERKSAPSLAVILFVENSLLKMWHVSLSHAMKCMAADNAPSYLHNAVE